MVSDMPTQVTSPKPHNLVLILVLMEYGLGLRTSLYDNSPLPDVLILVLMEYGLGPDNYLSVT